MQEIKRNTRFTRNKTEDMEKGRIKTQIISDLSFSRVPPQARELEEAVLGSILIERDAMGEIADILKPDAFYVLAHKTIFEFCLELFKSSKPIDMLSVMEALRAESKLEEVGGAFYLSELTNKVGSSANIEYYSRIIIQKYMQREVIRIANDAIRDAYEDTVDVFDLTDNVALSFMTIEELKGTNIKSLSQIKNKIKRELFENKPLAKLFKLGFNNLDFLSKTFNIIGGYQGTGKTAFVMSASANLAKQNWRVGIMSAEMSEMMLGSRAIQSDCSISSKRILTSNVSEYEKKQIIETPDKEEDKLIFVDESTELNHRNILTKIKTFVQRFKVDIVFIDYMQLVDVQEKGVLDVKGNEKLSTRLQTIDKKLDICIVGLSQLARGQNDERPNSNSLRNGGLEQAASDIFILYDENWKKNNGVQWNDIPSEIRGKIEVIYAKGRYSEVSSSFLFFNKPRQTMHDWNDRDNEDIMAEMEQQQPAKQNFDIF